MDLSTVFDAVIGTWSTIVAAILVGGLVWVGVDFALYAVRQVAALFGGEAHSARDSYDAAVDRRNAAEERYWMEQPSQLDSKDVSGYFKRKYS